MALIDDAEIQGWIDEELDDYANDLKDVMVDVIHVQTGNLRDSVTIEKKGDERSVGIDGDLVERKNGYDYSNVYYYGRGSWSGHKFLEEAMNRVD